MKLRELEFPLQAVVHLAHQHPQVIHRVVLDPEKVVTQNGHSIIRVGEYPGDEANGWQFLSAIDIIAIIGKATATRDGEKVTLTVTPIIERDNAVD